MGSHADGRIFISHAHADVLSARRLKSGLADAGYESWLAPDDMIGRDSWAGELLHEIDRCSAFVVLVSPATLESKHVHRELTLAVEHDKDVIPVLLEPVTLDGPLEYLLSTRHWVEADREAPQAAVDAIVRRITSEEAPTAEASGSRMSERTSRGKVSWDASRVPVPLDPIIGRDSLIASVVGAIRSGSRLITLRGPGGVGKTRLALAVAHVVAEEGLASVSFADLSEALDATSLMVGIANAVGYHGPSPEDPGEVAAALPDDPTLLVCDNLEQVAMHAAPLHQLLQAAPGLTALVTSRTRLGLAGESVVVVPPLELPPESGVDEAGPSPAVEVFLQAARHAVPGYTPTPAELQDVERVCRALDGLPLALELAASRLAIMSPAQLWERVGRPLVSNTAKATSSDRQASVEATIAWSLSLLSPPALAGFPRLGVFQGGFTLDAAEQVCSSAAESQADVDDWLSELVDASLVLTADAPSGRRFFLLQLLLAEARRRSPQVSLEQRHATYFAEIAERRACRDGGADRGSDHPRAHRRAPQLVAGVGLGRASRPPSLLPLGAGVARRLDRLSPPGGCAREPPVGGCPSLPHRARGGDARRALGDRGLPGQRHWLEVGSLERAVLHEAALQSDPDLVVLALELPGRGLPSGGQPRRRPRRGCSSPGLCGRPRRCPRRGGRLRHLSLCREPLVETSRRGAASSSGRSTLPSVRATTSECCFGLSTLGGLLIEEGDAAATRACADRLLDMVRNGRGLAHNERQGVRLLGIADVMDGDLASAARHLHSSLRDEERAPAQRRRKPDHGGRRARGGRGHRCRLTYSRPGPAAGNEVRGRPQGHTDSAARLSGQARA